MEAGSEAGSRKLEERKRDASSGFASSFQLPPLLPASRFKRRFRLQTSDFRLRVCHLSTTTLESKYFNTLGRGLAARGIALCGATLTAPDPPSWLTSSDYLFLRATSRASYPAAVFRLARWLRRQRVTVLQTHLFD